MHVQSVVTQHRAEPVTAVASTTGARLPPPTFARSHGRPEAMPATAKWPNCATTSILRCHSASVTYQAPSPSLPPSPNSAPYPALTPCSVERARPPVGFRPHRLLHPAASRRSSRPQRCGAGCGGRHGVWPHKQQASGRRGGVADSGTHRSHRLLHSRPHLGPGALHLSCLLRMSVTQAVPHPCRCQQCVHAPVVLRHGYDGRAVVCAVLAHVPCAQGCRRIPLSRTGG